MSVLVEVLRTGYSVLNVEKNIMKANCTCSLIIDDRNIVVVDTMTAWDRDVLKNELKTRSIDPNDVTHVIGTHGHSDHIGNLNLFTNALHVIGQSISRKDEYILHSFENDNHYIISENIEVVSTPGHTLSDVSVIVKNTSYGTVGIVGDLFEREEDIKNPTLWKEIAGSENPDLQFKNRQKILKLVHFIVPGHGPGFLVTKELITDHESKKY